MGLYDRFVRFVRYEDCISYSSAVDIPSTYVDQRFSHWSFKFISRVLSSKILMDSSDLQTPNEQTSIELPNNQISRDPNNLNFLFILSRK